MVHRKPVHRGRQPRVHVEHHHWWFLVHGSTGVQWVARCILEGLGDAVDDVSSLSGQINYQVFPLGVGLEDVRVTIAFDGAGTFGLGDEQGNACGCTDDEAVNFDPDAVYDDGSCDYDVWAARTWKHAITT